MTYSLFFNYLPTHLSKVGKVRRVKRSNRMNKIYRKLKGKNIPYKEPTTREHLSNLAKIKRCGYTILISRKIAINRAKNAQ